MAWTDKFCYVRHLEFNRCSLCGLNEDNKELFGEMIHIDVTNYHFNCHLFANGLHRVSPKTCDEILNWLLPKMQGNYIQKKHQTCSYCKNPGATIGCCATNCKKSFHLSCCLQYKSLRQFFETYLTFCRKHCLHQNKITEIMGKQCSICLEKITNQELISSLYFSCCNGGQAHRLCLQKYALFVGSHLFKCPVCYDSSIFMGEMSLYGLNIPLTMGPFEPQRYDQEELLHHPICTAPLCLSFDGRNFSTMKNDLWKILNCFYCGSKGTHRICSNLDLTDSKWICVECSSLEEEIQERKASVLPKLTLAEQELESEDKMDTS